MFLRKFFVSFALTVPVILYSGILDTLFGFFVPPFWGSAYIPFVLGSIVFFYGGLVFLQGAWRELAGKLPGMMTLIALAISVAYIYSVSVVFLGRLEESLFWELTTLITIMLLGHYLEMRAVQSAQRALKELSKLLPDTAEVLRDGKTSIIALSEVKIGDLAVVRPGGKIPADGTLIEGETEVDESMVSGESKPVSKKPNDSVIAGTINGDGSLKIRVDKIGEHTFLAGVMRLVQEAQASKSRLQILSDKAAYYLTLIAAASGGITFFAWILTGAGFDFAISRLVAVLVIACPHALGLAVPLVASISTTMAAKQGFLVRNRLAIESARKIDTVLLDKTGTLTKGEFGVMKIWSAGKISEEEVLRIAASVDEHSEHFVSKAIVRAAKEKNLDLYLARNFRRLPGRGVFGMINEKEVFAGGRGILNEVNLNLSAELERAVKQEIGKGETVIFVALGGEIAGAIALADLIREESREAIKELKAMGVKTAMITGDSEEVAKWVAEELGIDEYFARVLPNQKVDKVKELQARGLKVAMVGDGINDAPALTQADVGIAIGAGTNVAIESAGIILVKNDPRDIVKIIRLSRLTFSKMIQNLFWAVGYNIAAIPLAAGVLAYKGILLQPALAAVFMSFSTVIVAVNAVLMSRKKI
ncbi:MAG: copper-translocating P-type ATPase [Candidatus Harrisonbacteria bacterium RIFCSPLOWO2_02_FULL_41_11]|uniref:Copper-translocating P-type ATPase n=1 Tax=Candidatus Harrisonbacteria bacterium RIFCSPHIGHO2_02_FULL_42_16 TaxID=1798404 RepID=A0A1G1ZJJ5_9BACT|nr:MAG: copper-translocating P-type ATPase [Candidatus Harrisonbacteria bacterium RIFCSPHIGHO2_02_FULL_42_16]OGY66594.1 MAG: copper-translocating P-type ATPase [Candidatus Harrisonbacteria bacterium RIFCSPLOWO2_02_FULL_41_11]